MFYKSGKVMTILVAVLVGMQGYCQKNTTNKYPSLFWEITGNGLKKPSYLFGTMHVSNKMVFHLSDSFYFAMKNVDAVALELNPDVWQGQMVSLDRLKQNYANFVKSPGNDFLTENSFRITNYDDELKVALATEPTIVNNLLYRSYKAKEDFEEDTFLDMYIFQTGKKLGKRSAGVEDFYETEKIVLQAYSDMATEKNKKPVDTDGESMGDITKKMQDAYRRGDLDLMDSLDIMTERSVAFRENFLYRRNEVQANSIDTILKKSSLFVGVGAAHLPGDRGVIELLRKMGYRLRPIKMTDRDAEKKDETDKLKVPVIFSERKAEDAFFSVDMPGPLFKMTDEYQGFDRRQYADMSNGSYYLVTRIKTHAAFLGQSEDQVMKKVDSMLYENIPGKIVKKLRIEKSGYRGFDLTNKTRTGDLQRYNIFVTPFEILIFKMSGKENYV
ncbi:TraB/GumN family protein, partial [Ferruginibacter sp.]